MELLSYLLKIVIGFVIAIVGLFMIYSVLSSFNTYDQIAFANVEKLRSAINEVCLTENKETIQFSLPQNVPMFGPAFMRILPKFAMGIYGEPKYILYYESFPPGEAVGWEVYHDFPYRIIGPVKKSGGSLSVKDSIKSISNEFANEIANTNDLTKAVYAGFPYNILINNVIISPEIDLTSGDFVDEDSKKKLWDEKTESFSGFANYFKMDTLNKTLSKYMACGDNSLCLKTSSGVYTFPLTYCNDIKYLQLVYDARGVELSKDWKKILGLGGVGGYLGYKGAAPLNKVLGVLGKGKLGAFGPAAFGTLSLFMLLSSTSYKVSDFYAASPCSNVEFEIEKIDDCTEPGGGLISTKIYDCDNMQTYKLYKFSGNELKENGDHYTCIDNVIGDEGGMNKLPTPCIRLTVKNRLKTDDFCWTRNPYMSSKLTWSEEVKHGVITYVFKPLIAGIGAALYPPSLLITVPDLIIEATKGDVRNDVLFALNMLPVTTSTKYLDSVQSFVLSSGAKVDAESSLFKSIFSENLFWGWP